MFNDKKERVFMPILIFIRHAQTNYNEQGLFTGQQESYVTEEGLKMTREKFAQFDKNFDYIYRSPLLRTKQTLDAIIPGANAIIDKRITETGLGEWEGKEKDKLDPKLVAEFRAGKYWPPKAEPKEKIFKRINDFMKDLFEKYKSNERILIVTHAGVIRTINKIVYGETMNRIDNLDTLEINDKVYKEYVLKNKGE